MAAMTGSPIHFLVAFLVIVGAPALLGLLALMIGASQFRWSVKAGLLAVALLILLPTKLTTPLVVAAWALPGITLLTSVLSRRRGDRPDPDEPPEGAKRLQFQVADLLLVMMFVGTILAIVRASDDPFGIHSYDVLAILVGASIGLAVCAYASVAWPYGWLGVPLIAALSVLPAYFCAPSSNDFYPSPQVIGTAALPWAEAKPWMYVWAFFVEVACVAAVGFALARQASRPGRNLIWRITLGGFLLLFGAPSIAAFYDLVRPAIPYPASISGPNNFERLANVCAELQSVAPYHFNELDLPILLNTDERNRRADLYDEILKQAELPSYLPDKYARDPSLDMKELMEFIRPFARRAARDAAAMAPDDPARSAEIALALAWIGSHAQRNGVCIHLLVGASFESMGMKELIRVRGDLTPAVQRRIIAELLRTDTSRDTLNQIVRREQAWCERNLPTVDRLSNSLERFAIGREVFSKPYVAMVKRRDAFLRLLMLDLALRLYAKQHGVHPERLEQLVPLYLPSVPLDPFGGTPPVYRVTGSMFTLYSAGPNGRDDGGRFGSLKELTSEGASAVNWDFDLDTVLR